MIDRSQFSHWLLRQPEATSDAALRRIALAKRRIQSNLDTLSVAHQKTLEQKISDQGPEPQRVDPHLVGRAIKDLLERNRLRTHYHQLTGSQSWYANVGTSDELVQSKLQTLAPLYSAVSGHGFGNLVGDALEVVVYKCLEHARNENPRFAFLGQFDLSSPKLNGRYRKTGPPRALAGRTSTREPDFFQFGHDCGPLAIECKNYREWLYPDHPVIAELIGKALDLATVPVLIARRIHYTARAHLLEPAGIVFHETLFQYYPADKAEIAEQVKERLGLGFSDVTALEEPHAITRDFFKNKLSVLAEKAYPKWQRNKTALTDFAERRIDLRALYKHIGSRAAQL